MSTSQIYLEIHLSEECINLFSIKHQNDPAFVSINNSPASYTYTPVINFSNTSSEIRVANAAADDKNYTVINDFVSLLGIRGNRVDTVNTTSHNCTLTNKDGYIAYNFVYNNTNVVITPKDVCTMFINYICSKSLETVISTDCPYKDDDVNIVIAVPSSFSLIQKELVIQSVKAAGYNNVNIVADSLASMFSLASNARINTEGIKTHFKKPSCYKSMANTDGNTMQFTDRLDKENINLKRILENLSNADVNHVEFNQKSGKESNLDKLIQEKYKNSTIYNIENSNDIFSKDTSIYSYYFAQNETNDNDVSKSVSLIIDIGDDYCFGYYYKDKKEKIIEKNGIDLFPSIVYFSKEDNEKIVGSKPSLIKCEKYTAIKKATYYLGKKKSDIYENENENMDFQIDEDKDNYCMFKVHGNNHDKQCYYPTEIVSMLLEFMKKIAIEQIGEDNFNNGNEYLPVIIPIPVEFNDFQRNEICRAASKAGLKVICLIPEPVCALISSITEKEIQDEECNVLVFHLSNESCKVTILSRSGYDISIVYTCSDRTIGRMAIVNKIEMFIINRMMIFLNLNRLPDDILEIRKKIRNELKKDNLIFEYSANGKKYSIKLTKEEIERLCEDELHKISEIVKQAISDSLIPILQYVILVGRGSRYSAVIDTLKKQVNEKMCMKINEYETIIKGGLEFAKYCDDNYSGPKFNNVFLPRSVSLKIKHRKTKLLSYGVDLGTTYSCAAFLKADGNTEFFDSNASRDLGNFLPSCVSYNKDTDDILVGEPALHVKPNKADLLYNSKRFIGKTYEEIKKENIESFPFKLINRDGKPAYRITHNGEEKVIYPYIVSSEILKKINRLFVDRISNVSYSPEDIQVVIGVPATFTDAQMEDTIRAANEVGFGEIVLIPEASAATLAYIYSNSLIEEDNNEEQYFLVYDFGGATFNVSVVHVKDKHINVIASDSNDHLGGEDVTRRLEDYVTDQIKNKFKDMNITPKIRKRIHQECEALKKNLSNKENQESELIIELIDDEEFNTAISTATFNEICKDLYFKTIDIADNVLEKSHISKRNINYVVLSGGSSRIIKVKELLKQEFVDSKICDDINSNEIVAKGCAIYANSMNSNEANRYKIKEKIKGYPQYEEKIVFCRCSDIPSNEERIIDVDGGEISVEIQKDDGFDKMDNIGCVSLKVSQKENEDDRVRISMNISKDSKLRVKLNEIRKNQEGENVEKEFQI